MNKGGSRSNGCSKLIKTIRSGTWRCRCRRFRARHNVCRNSHKERDRESACQAPDGHGLHPGDRDKCSGANQPAKAQLEQLSCQPVISARKTTTAHARVSRSEAEAADGSRGSGGGSKAWNRHDCFLRVLESVDANFARHLPERETKVPTDQCSLYAVERDGMCDGESSRAIGLIIRLTLLRATFGVHEGNERKGTSATRRNLRVRFQILVYDPLSECARVRLRCDHGRWHNLVDLNEQFGDCNASPAMEDPLTLRLTLSRTQMVQRTATVTPESNTNT